jgi:hypothetical protein
VRRSASSAIFGAIRELDERDTQRRLREVWGLALGAALVLSALVAQHL